MTSPSMLAQHLPRAHRGHGQPAHANNSQIHRLIRHLATTQVGGIGFIRDTPVGSPLLAHVQSMMGPSTVLNAPKCGSGAHRPTHVWQNLLPKDKLDEAYSNLPNPSRTVNDNLDLARLEEWRMPTTDTPNSIANPTKALPRFGTRHTPPSRAESGPTPALGLLMKDGTPTSPSPEVREILMGFIKGDTEVEGLSPGQRVHLLGQCTYLDILYWALTLASTTSGRSISRPRAHPGSP